MFSFKRLKAIRGAVCAENTKDSILENSVFLYKEILRQNRIKEKDVTAIFFTITNDLTAFNPATALRLNGLALENALFCSAEPFIENSSPYVIRIMLLCYSCRKPKFIYARGAENLRNTENKLSH